MGLSSTAPALLAAIMARTNISAKALDRVCSTAFDGAVSVRSWLMPLGQERDKLVETEGLIPLWEVRDV